jgi:hypothetical protein
MPTMFDLVFIHKGYTWYIPSIYLVYMYSECMSPLRESIIWLDVFAKNSWIVVGSSTNVTNLKTRQAIPTYSKYMHASIIHPIFYLTIHILFMLIWTCSCSAGGSGKFKTQVVSDFSVLNSRPKNGTYSLITFLFPGSLKLTRRFSLLHRTCSWTNCPKLMALST